MCVCVYIYVPKWAKRFSQVDFDLFRIMLWRWPNFALACEEGSFYLQAVQLSPEKGHFSWGSEIIEKLGTKIFYYQVKHAFWL